LATRIKDNFNLNNFLPVDSLKKLQTLLYDSTVGLFTHCQRTLVKAAKIEVASLYIKVVQNLRWQFLVLTGLWFVLAFLAISLVVAPFMVVLFAPIASNLKFIFVCVLSIVDIAVPAFLLSYFLSEKKWMQFSKSDELIEKVLKGN